MTFPRARLTAALTMTVATAVASSLALVGTARADDTQSAAEQSMDSWTPGNTLPLSNSKSVEASSVSASTLTFPAATDEQTKIFILSSDSSDAILIESGGWYGIIDGGEDADLPDGSDPRYPVRTGTAAAAGSTTEWLMQYLDDQGLNDTNVAFYLGTHAHSDHIAAEVGEVDMLKAGHHGAESSNSVPFMAALHPGAIIQTGAASHSPDRLSFLVLHGDTKWFPMGNIWESLNVPALVCVFADDEIQYDGVAHAQWGHEYESENPRAWWFRAGRPAATTGWWDGPSGNRYYFDGSASALANQWAVIDGVTYHFDATGALDATASTLTGSGVAGSFAASAWRYVLLGAALTALAGAGVAIAGRMGGS
ncbi:MBL fold metallo-hydrolase [Schaalia odontolytica]|uniref:MBL fold metallo-hydrolase n=1 Tax=Schaalia odontolytica TaxID=1660 RepID=UPI00211CBC82|nr:MBL fold metallo-hydrolase [Schaalia odontolytica]UUO93367.1 MBL fold metallo-hydrolase [Schaalia odontolytica]